jgi:hypothetical protein
MKRRLLVRLAYHEAVMRSQAEKPKPKRRRRKLSEIVATIAAKSKA